MATNSLLRPGLLGAKTLARVLGVWPFFGLLAWALMIKLQEPTFFARQGVPFFWESHRAMMLLGVGLLPLIWRLALDPDASLWALRSARSVVHQVCATWFGVIAYGAVLVLFGLLVGITVEGIVGVEPQWRDGLVAAGQTLGFLVLSAAFCPALALLRTGATTAVFAWLLVLATLLQFFGPWEISGAPIASTILSGMLSISLATVGGLALSLAHSHYRIRR